jgi:hypothetical protein|tara:strand:- start:17015 stop:17242 length:228 start_codon:yes stop_codon:yes gene_type:complete
MNDRIDIKDKKTLIRLLRSCYFVYAYIVLGGGNASGFSIKLQKTDLMLQLKDCEIDLTKFRYDAQENNIYIDSYL